MRAINIKKRPVILFFLLLIECLCITWANGKIVYLRHIKNGAWYEQYSVLVPPLRETFTVSLQRAQPEQKEIEPCNDTAYTIEVVPIRGGPRDGNILSVCTPYEADFKRLVIAAGGRK
jgi:hypothetical protein